MPFQDQVEMGLTLGEVVSITQNRPYYPNLFTAAFGDPSITSQRIAHALAQFVRSIVSVNSRYDQGRALVNRPTDNFPHFNTQGESGETGLFQSSGKRGACIDCHVSEAFVSPPLGTPHASATSAATNDGLDAISTIDLGIAESKGNVADTGKFKVPSLRFAQYRAHPLYMHDGRFADRNAVLNFYDRDIRNHAQLSDMLRGNNGKAQRINLNRNDRAVVVAFLGTLTDHALVTDPKFSDPFIEVADDESAVVITSPTEPFHLTNISTRARLNTPSATMVSGFIIGGPGTKQLLIRGVGPALRTFGVDAVLPAPSLALLSGDTEIAANTDWRNSTSPTQLAQVAAAHGAFPLSAIRADSAILTSLEAGAYTVHLTLNQ